MRDKLGCGNGVLEHHLRVLEKDGSVISRHERNRRAIYPSSRGHPPIGLDGLSEIQAGILCHVQLEQGINQGALAQRLGMSKQALNHHLRELCARKLVYRRKEGRCTRFYVDPGRLSEELL